MQGTQEIPFGHQAGFLCCVDDGAQPTQRLWKILLGDLQELSGFGPGTLLWLSLLGHNLEQMDPEGHATFTMMWFCESSPLCLMEARNQANTLVSLASCPDFPVSSLLPVFFNSVIASSVCGSVIRFFHRTYKHSNYEIFYHYEVVSTLSPPLFV